MKKETIKGYKGFDKGLKCRDFQYKENTTFTTKEKPELCESGFHFCENPLDVLDYYNLCDSEFAEVEAIGKTKSDNQKTVTNKIKIGLKIDLKSFIKASIDFIWEKCKISEGENVQASSGDYSKLELSGKDSVGANIGIKGIIKASKGCWITLAEYDNNNKILCVKSAKVTGKTIKSGIWYKLIDGKFTEV